MRIEFAKVDEENLDEVLKLEIHNHQLEMIEPIIECYNESLEKPCWRPKAVYVDGILVAFVMYGFFEDEGENGRLWLDRFLIDKKYQGQHLSFPILSDVVEILKAEYDVKVISLSVYKNNPIAIKVYEKLGFKFTGLFDTKGESMMEYKVIR